MQRCLPGPEQAGGLQDVAAARAAYQGLGDHLRGLGLEAEVAVELAGLLDRHLEALDRALGGGSVESLGPPAGRLVGAVTCCGDGDRRPAGVGRPRPLKGGQRRRRCRPKGSIPLAATVLCGLAFTASGYQAESPQRPAGDPGAARRVESTVSLSTSSRRFWRVPVAKRSL